MTGYIAICDPQGNIIKIIQSTPADISREGQDLHELFTDPEDFDRLLAVADSQFTPVRLKFWGESHDVLVSVKKAGKYLLFLMTDAEDKESLSRTMEFFFSSIDELEALNTEEFRASLWELQKVNNQLINYQRALAKANERLKLLLEEAREAKSTIELLERDPLTTLYTMNSFLERSEAMLKRNPETEYDLIAINIERFKLVNDTFGMEQGDRLLTELAHCLLSVHIPEQSLFARGGADNFYILVPRALKVHRQLNENIEFFEGNYPLPMRIQIKMGIYEIDDHSIGLTRMCDRAALACSSIKGIYNRNLAYYDDSIRRKLLIEQKILDTMVESLERGEFQVYLQPKVDINTEQVIGAEALVRWFHSDIGMISPADFIPVFEKNGFIYSLDRYVWKKTCEISREWKEKSGTVIPVSVNVSRLDIHQPDLPDIIRQITDSCGLKPEDLHLEITETAYVSDTRQMLAAIRQLKQMGFIIEMDDFGKGYSSLHTLSELPIDILKMDLGFLSSDGISDSDDNLSRREQVMKFVLDLAGELHLPVIAEGAETKTQIELLKSMGCRYAQGYYYGKPMPKEEFFRYLEEKK